MFENLKTQYKAMDPKRKKILVIVVAVVVFFGFLAIFTPEPVHRDRGLSPKADQVKNVFTDRSSRGDSIDAISGRLSQLAAQNETMQREIERLRSQNARETKAQQKALEEKIAALTAEMTHMRETMSLPQSADSVFKASELKEGAGDQDSSDGQSSSRRSSRKGLSMSVISENIKEPKKEKEVEEPVKSVAYIPAGSIITGTIITGGDFPTNAGGFENPTPLLIRISKEAILPNRYTSDIRECFLLTGGRGDLASERVKLRGETLSCIRDDGSVIESKLNSYVAGEDGKEGVKGRLVSKQGQIIARSLVAGFASGLSDAFDVNAVPTISTSSDGTVEYQQVYSSDALQGAAVKGFSNAMERISEFYLDMAKDIFPVVEVNAGRQVDVVVTTGTELAISAEGAFKDPYAQGYNQ